jgi:predicted dehydrogenase
MPGVEIVAVANRSLESSQRAADEFDIPRAYADWEQLLAADGIDAVLIGTWPYMHRTITLAALDSGRHVLCQARMANNAAEAHEMLRASQRHANLVCQLVPSSSGYSIDRALLSLLGSDLLGEVLSVEVQRRQRGFANFGGELDWRHNPEFSGINVLNVGAIYELMMRWLGPGNRVMAKTRVHVPTRRDERGVSRPATIPDHVEVLYELGNGAPVHMTFSETTGLSRGNDTWIFGSEGTIHVDNEQNIFVGRRGDRDLAPHPNPPEGQFRHRVEEEFINAIRGIEPVTMNTFEIGVRYMEWTEAIYRSQESGAAVSLPLAV